MSDKEKTTYKDAGVDIKAGEDLVEKILPFAKSTKRDGVMSGLGGFGGVFDIAKSGYKNPLLVSATDGVGTKLKIAIATKIYNFIGIDLVAMCVNDILTHGAEPLFFLDYYACGNLNIEDAANVIQSIAKGCKIANCSLIGGETAEMPDMYQNGEFDIAGFSVGAVEREKLLPVTNAIKSGDKLIALPSSGLHANGFSLVRHILSEKNISLDKIFEGKILAETLLTPTKIYVDEILPLLKRDNIKDGYIKAMAHITGGGITGNLPRILPSDKAAEIKRNIMKTPEIFSFLQKEGNVADDEMLSSFNLGVGMILIVDKNKAEEVISLIEHSYIIGDIIEGSGKVKII